MKSDPPRVPTPPITLELRDRLAKFIAERPPQQLTWMLSGPLGEIIAERIAGLPLEQRTEVAQLTILEVLLTRQEVPLTGLVRRHVVLELAQRWIPKREWNKICKQRELTPIEALYFLAQRARKTKAWPPGKPKPEAFKKTALEAVADAVGKEPEALAQSLRRSRRARKNHNPEQG